MSSISSHTHGYCELRPCSSRYSREAENCLADEYVVLVIVISCGSGGFGVCEQWGICVLIRSAASLMSHDSSFAHLLGRHSLR